MAQEYPQLPPAPQSSTLAIVSLISGIVSWFALPVLGGIVAIITGHMGKNEIKNSGGMIGGEGMATAGLILGYVNIAVWILCACISFVIPLLLGLPFFFGFGSNGY